MANIGLIKKFSDKNYRFTALLCLVLFSFPLGIQAFTNGLLLLLLLHCFIFLNGYEWRRGFSSMVFIIPAVFYLLHALSLFWSEHTADGLRQLETKLSFVLAPLLITAAISDKNTSGIKDRSLRALLYGSLLASVLILTYATYRSIEAGAFYQMNNAGGKQYFFLYTHLAKPIMHPTYLSTFLAFSGFISFYFLRKEKSKRGIHLFFLFLLFTTMVLLQARMVLIAVFVVMFTAVLAYVWKRRDFKWLLLPVIPLLLLSTFIIFASENLKKRYFQLPDFSYDISGDSFNSATYRLAEWSSALDVIQKHPVIGTGIGDNRAELLAAYEENKFWKGVERKFNAHNQYLETTIVTGILGLILLLAMFIYYAKTALKKSDYLSVALLLFFALCLLTESMFERQWGVLLFTVYFPLALSCRNSAGYNSEG